MRKDEIVARLFQRALRNIQEAAILSPAAFPEALCDIGGNGNGRICCASPYFSRSGSDSYLDVQQDILETFTAHGDLPKLAQSTVMPNGKRIPGLELDHPRQLDLMRALARFANIAAGGTFRTTNLHGTAVAAS